MTCSKDGCKNEAIWMVEDLEKGKVLAACNLDLAELVSDMRAFVGSTFSNDGLEARRRKHELTKANAG